MPHVPVVDDSAFLPPHEATAVEGFHAYSRRMGIKPGQTLDLRVSNDGPVEIEIVRHGAAIGVGETSVAKLPRVDATLRRVHRGSYVFVERGIDAWPPVTLEVWVRVLVESAGAGLFDKKGLHLGLSDGRVPSFAVETSSGKFETIGPALSLREWHHLVCVFDVDRITLFVDGEATEPVRVAGDYAPSAGPLLIGARPNTAGEASDFLTGDLCAPSAYNVALSPELIIRRFRDKTLEPARGCIGHWKFDALGGKKPYRDASRARHHGKPVNYPVRMIPGPRRTHDSDWHTYDPTADPDFGFAVRLMGDALVDCRWPVTTSWKAPRNLRPGQYAAKIANAAGEVRYVHFILRPAKRSAKMACFSTTSTRVAYNFQPFNNQKLDYGAYQPHPSFPMLGHILGVGRPAGGSWSAVTVNFELPFYAWLERENIAYDLYTEWDLEADPALLDGYTVAAWAGHSEYWTAAQHSTLKKFLRRGGRLLSMSGNTAFWRVSADLKNSVIEVRKHDRRAMPGVTSGPMIHAAHHHQLDHLPGSYMHTTGYPQSGLGLGQTGGFTDPPLDGPRAGYEVLEPDHPLFRTPRPIDTAAPFAPDASGYETDCSCRSMFERFGESKIPHYPPADGSAAPTLARCRAEGPVILARSKIAKCHALDYDVNYFAPKEGVEMWSEMLYQEHAGGGITFACGSVLSGEVLLKDANFSNFLLNVLARMGVSA